MRTLVITLLLASGLAGCAASNAEQGQRSLKSQQTLDRYLTGKVAGTPQSCLPHYRANDMVVVDENTILFRDGANRVWRNDPLGGCSSLGRAGTALVTNSIGGTGLCRGEIARIVDTANGFTVGSCSLSDFVPYRTPDRG